MPYKPSLTIVITAYNEEQYIGNAVQSLLDQTYTNFILKIINNGSTDSTGKILKGFAEKDSRVTVITNEKNIPPRVIDLDSIETPYVLPIAAHDYWLPQFLEKCIARLEADPRVVLAYSKTMFMKGEQGKEKIFGPIPAVFETMHMTPINRVIFVTMGLVEAYQQFGVYRTDALKKTKKNNVVLFDHVWLAELATIGMFAMVDEPLFYLRQAPDWGDKAVFRRKHFPDEVNSLNPFLEMLEAFMGITDNFNDHFDGPLLRMALLSCCCLRHKSIIELFGETTDSLLALPAFKELHQNIDIISRKFMHELVTRKTKDQPTIEFSVDTSPVVVAAFPAEELCPCHSNKPFKNCHGDFDWDRQLSTAIPTLPTANGMLFQALSYAKRGNVPLADQLVRTYLAQNRKNADALTLLAEIALKINLPKIALGYFSKLLEILKDRVECQGRAATARATMGLIESYYNKPEVKPSAPKYLLIKAWGGNFWSDIDHVIGSLLVAELTGRIPVVHWGANSLFSEETVESAFDFYFEPASEFSIDDLCSDTYSYFPLKWNSRNLREENIDKWSGPYSRQSGILFLGRNEDVVVSDFHTPVSHLMAWIPEESIYSGMTWYELHQRLFDRYIRLKPHLAATVDNFYGNTMSGRSWLAIHVRDSGMPSQQVELDKYQHLIEDLIEHNSDLGLFLLTDSTNYLEQFRNRYGERVFTSDTRRTDGDAKGDSGKGGGESVIFDSYLALKCDYFIGNGESYLSSTLGSLKSWEDGHYRLIGRDLRSNIDMSDYIW